MLAEGSPATTLSEVGCRLMDEINRLLDAKHVDLRDLTTKEEAFVNLAMENMMTAECLVRTLRETRGV